jgi:hypothetical protein
MISSIWRDTRVSTITVMRHDMLASNSDSQRYIAKFNDLCSNQPPFSAEPSPCLWEIVDPTKPSDSQQALQIIRKDLSSHGIRPIAMISNCFKFVRAASFALLASEVRHTVTIGNVLVNGKPVYKTTEASIEHDMAEGYDETTPADAHAWLTLRNGIVVDLTILSLLASRENRKPLKLIHGIYSSDILSSHRIQHIPLFLGPAYWMRVTTPREPIGFDLSYRWLLKIDSVLKVSKSGA